MIQLLLKRGADVNGQPSIKYGATALQFAVIKGHLGIVSMLLESGADINAPGAQEEGRTALEAAAEHGRLDIMYLLLQNDNDVETLEARCKKAAKLATSEGHAVLAKVLREWKASDS
ncbi:hypothetical protein SCUCBS95973_002996 [Sporothrix curviconia]|uniref:Ankyrin repeat protein n=1 Tax=Sporothrix curviconia TaxID=1260050 RepID=A0ABP0BBP6_9PEZI